MQDLNHQQYLLRRGNLTQATQEAIAIYSHDLAASYLGNATRFSSSLRKVHSSHTFSVGNFQTNTAVQNHQILHPDIPRNSSVLSVYVGHDASIALSHSGRILCVLELERLYKIRYFGPLQKDYHGLGFRSSMQFALRRFSEQCQAGEEQARPM
ncbi:unnamed protein product, partial [Symbiodinium necroappetens]